MSPDIAPWTQTPRRGYSAALDADRGALVLEMTGRGRRICVGLPYRWLNVSALSWRVTVARALRRCREELRRDP